MSFYQRIKRSQCWKFEIIRKRKYKKNLTISRIRFDNGISRNIIRTNKLFN
jgi:hypothetical protein